MNETALYRYRLTISGIAVSVGEARELARLQVRDGTVVDYRDIDDLPIPCLVGPESAATEIYVIHRLYAKTGRYRDDLVLLGFADASTARAVFFAQAVSPKEYRQLDTWKAERFRAWLNDEVGFDEDEEDTEESCDEADEV